jgi:hypothetical protein
LIPDVVDRFGEITSRHLGKTDSGRSCTWTRYK